MPRGNQNVDEETIDGRSPDGGRRILSGTAVVKCAIKAEPVRLVSRLQHVKIASSTYFAKESSFSQLANSRHPSAAFDRGAEQRPSVGTMVEEGCQGSPSCREARIRIIGVWVVVVWVWVHQWCRSHVRVPYSLMWWSL